MPIMRPGTPLSCDCWPESPSPKFPLSEAPPEPLEPPSLRRTNLLRITPPSTCGTESLPSTAAGPLRSWFSAGNRWLPGPATTSKRRPAGLRNTCREAWVVASWTPRYSAASAARRPRRREPCLKNCIRRPWTSWPGIGTPLIRWQMHFSKRKPLPKQSLKRFYKTDRLSQQGRAVFHWFQTLCIPHA